MGRHRARRLMRVMGLQAIYQAPRTTTRHPEHRVCPYLPKGLAIERPNQVWTADITYIPVQRGFLYLVAIMDWATCRVLSWRLSNTLDARFCTEALTEALERYGRPQIFNTDQGSQFTSLEFTATLKDAGVAISMDGRGRCMDNIFIEACRAHSSTRPSTCTVGPKPVNSKSTSMPPRNAGTYTIGNLGFAPFETPYRTTYNSNPSEQT